MKKAYQKPMFMVEYYTLTQSIASCSGKPEYMCRLNRAYRQQLSELANTL